MNTTGRHLRTPALRDSRRGLTLIELLVAMLISLILSLAIFKVLGGAEAFKRNTTSVNDINQGGNYAMYTIDKWIRSAGSGFAQTSANAFGCKLHAAKASTQILPMPAPAVVPFDWINPTGTAGEFRLAPVLIVPRNPPAGTVS